jgi:membrane-associated protease RseP (regulator of RpoE activity)
LKEWKTPIILFLITLFTTTVTGASFVGAPFSELHRGLSFSVPLLIILLTHEMGHFLAAKYHNVAVSPPYFIPIPPQIGIGTFGAVIRIREPIASKQALMDIGAAGPLAGLIMTIPILIYGIYLSPVSHVPLISDVSIMSEGNSLLYLSLKFFVHGEFLPSGGKDILMHPIAFAGWIGLLITMINLIPVGQLDGGHVAFAWFGDKYKKYSKKLHKLLPIMGIGVFIYVASDVLFTETIKVEAGKLMGFSYKAQSFGNAVGAGISSAMPWFIWPLILYVLTRISGGIIHPPVGKDKLGKRGKILAIITFIMFILIFMPIPMRIS